MWYKASCVPPAGDAERKGGGEGSDGVFLLARAGASVYQPEIVSLFDESRVPRAPASEPRCSHTAHAGCGGARVMADARADWPAAPPPCGLVAGVRACRRRARIGSRMLSAAWRREGCICSDVPRVFETNFDRS
jgi:hypothetical protein